MRCPPDGAMFIDLQPCTQSIRAATVQRGCSRHSSRRARRSVSSSPSAAAVRRTSPGRRVDPLQSRRAAPPSARRMSRSTSERPPLRSTPRAGSLRSGIGATASWCTSADERLRHLGHDPVEATPGVEVSRGSTRLPSRTTASVGLLNRLSIACRSSSAPTASGYCSIAMQRVALEPGHRVGRQRGDRERPLRRRRLAESSPGARMRVPRLRDRPRARLVLRHS